MIMSGVVPKDLLRPWCLFSYSMRGRAALDVLTIHFGSNDIGEINCFRLVNIQVLKTGQLGLIEFPEDISPLIQEASHQL